MARRRAEFFNGKSCVYCGSTSGLQLDHIDPLKKVNHKIWSWSEARRNAELAKCQVLCEPCHRAKTAVDRTNAAMQKHGTYYMRWIVGCGCDECKEYVRQQKRESRARLELAQQ